MKSKHTYPLKKKKRTSESSRWLLFLASLFLVLAIILCWLSVPVVRVVPNMPVTLEAPATQTPMPCDFPLAFQAVAYNDDWIPCKRIFDGVTMMLVPIGCYYFNGTEDQLPTEYCFEKPYWIDKYEVTNEAYGALTCSYWSTAPDQPHVCVEWHEAFEFCKSRNARLPSEEEWEYAARGVDNLLYPWGNEWDHHKVHWNIETSNQAVSVSSYSPGVSWVGAYHMSGNVWEWVTSTSSYNVARGGSYNSSTVDLPTTIFRIRHGSYEGNGTGFRCVRDFSEMD